MGPMNFVDDVSRWLTAVLHVVMTLVAIPYFLLAGYFVMIGRIASQRGLWDILDSFLTSFNWIATWGFLLLGVTVTTIAGMGFWESKRWLATMALGVLMATTLGILLFYRTSIPTLDELYFLAPGILVISYCCWQLLSHHD